MNVWNNLDLEALDMRDRIILLTEEFNAKHGESVNDYNQKLNRFIDKKLKRESDLLFRKQFFVTTLSLGILNRKVYK